MEPTDPLDAMDSAHDDPDLRRMAQLADALDEQLLTAAPPTPEEIETEINDLIAEAPQLGEDPADTEQQVRQLSYAFWRDWFAVDPLITPLGIADEEVWNLCLAREAARRPNIYGAQA
jgi:hypothetical protein